MKEILRKKDIPATVTRAVNFIVDNNDLYFGCASYDIVVENGMFALKCGAEEGAAIPKHGYSGDTLTDTLKSVGRVTLPKNNFWSKNIKYSPLEVDRNKGKGIFKGRAEDVKPSYPLYMVPAIAFVAANGMFPTFDEFAMVYIQAYFEPYKASKPADDTFEYYAPGLDKKVPRYDIGKKLEGVEYIFTNKVLTGNEFCSHVAALFPCRELTTDMILNRLYKAYPSIIRKLYCAFAAAKYSNSVKYSFSDDLFNGIHFTVNGRIVRVNINSSFAKTCSKTKIDYSHEYFRRQKIINFNFDTRDAEPGEFLLPTHEGIKELIRIGGIPRLYMNAEVAANQ